MGVGLIFTAVVLNTVDISDSVPFFATVVSIVPIKTSHCRLTISS